MITIEKRIIGILGLPLRVIEEALEEEVGPTQKWAHEVVAEQLPQCVTFESLARVTLEYRPDSTESRAVVRIVRDMMDAPGFSMEQALHADVRAREDRQEALRQMYQ